MKYAPKSSEVRVEFKEMADEILFSVESIGPVIEDREMEAIFNQGFRGEGARNSHVSGSGLGLYTARKLLAEYRGVLTVESIKREGNTALNIFTVNIPCQRRSLVG